MNKNNLAHTKWNCKYHIVFAPKYKRQIIYEKIKTDIGKIIRKLCDQKRVETPIINFMINLQAWDRTDDKTGLVVEKNILN